MGRSKSLKFGVVITFIILFVYPAIIIAANDSAAIRAKIIVKAYSKTNLHYSGDEQYTTTGKSVKSPLRVMITDQNNHPVSDFPVKFRFLSFPDKASGQTIEPAVQKTDSSGMAEAYVKLGSKAGEYEISANINGNSDNSFVVFKLHARKSNWVFILIIGLIGGLGLFLMGMSMMSDGLQKSAGDRMRTVLSKLTYNKYIALLVGTFVTMVIQSSSATSVMLVSFVNSRLMRFRQTIGIFMGAAIGTTITAQIIAFKITDYALLIIGIGFFTNILFKSQSVKNAGEAILGFGILFFGMQVMSDAMYPLRTYEPFIKVLYELENPALGILAGAVLTALIQSSSAFIGIMIILATQGLLTLPAAIPLLIGANLGTTVTATLASMKGSRESKQVAVAFTIFKASGALILIWWIPGFVELVQKTSPPGSLTATSYDAIAQTLPRQIANAHTIYNVLLAVIFLPLVGPFERLINRIIPLGKEEREIFRVKYLDESMIKTPSLALNLAKQEVLRMMEIVQSMTEKIMKPFMEKDTSVFAAIDESESQVNMLRDRINDYLVKITRQHVDSKRVDEAFQLMFAVNEFEQVADIVSTNLRDKAKSWCNSDYDFSSQGKKELNEYHKHTIEQLQRARDLYTSFSLDEARKMKAKYKAYRNMTFELEKQHFERLKSRVEESIASSKTHIELMTMLKLIASHATNTARILMNKNIL